MKDLHLDLLTKDLQNYIVNLPNEFEQIPTARQADLLAISTYIRTKQKAQKTISITVICTHNSRRSHIGQIWLQVAAACYGIPDFQSFSGGTEATAFHPNAIEAMRRTGVDIQKINTLSNPVYSCSFSETQPSFQVFSKVYHAQANPQHDFAALLVCTSADEACPSVLGADARFPIPFDDPKAFDHTNLAATKYDERARQIAREFFFLMSRV